MSCNCGCPANATPATGWRKFVPLIVAAAVAGALIAGAILKSHENSKNANDQDAKQTSAAARP